MSYSFSDAALKNQIALLKLSMKRLERALYVSIPTVGVLVIVAAGLDPRQSSIEGTLQLMFILLGGGLLAAVAVFVRQVFRIRQRSTEINDLLQAGPFDEWARRWVSTLESDVGGHLWKGENAELAMVVDLLPEQNLAGPALKRTAYFRAVDGKWFSYTGEVTNQGWWFVGFEPVDEDLVKHALVEHECYGHFFGISESSGER